MYLDIAQIYKDIEKVNSLESDSKVRLISYISDRKGRKSSAIQELIFDSVFDGHPAIVIREKSNRPVTENWLSDYELEYVHSNGWTLFTETISEYKGGMTRVMLCTDPDDPCDNTYILCYGMYLSLADVYKSNYFQGWSDVKYVIWEECVPKKQLIQNEKHILDRCMGQMIDLMSICSTVARNNPVTVFLLGNDLSYNILNPVTLSFKILERLKINKTITDYAEIDDIQYPFLFRYFDFPDSVNHWLIDKNNRVDSGLDVSSLNCVPLSVSTDFCTYYFYYYKNTIYISDKATQKNSIRCVRDLISYLGYEPSRTVKPDAQIQCIRRVDREADRKCMKFFDHGRFIPQESEKIPNLKLNAIMQMKKHQFEQIPEHDTFFSICKKSVTDTTMIYCNFYIKVLLEKIFYLFL